MFLKNNKGFSMLEILVSVGIVSLLIGVAAPAYNQYKKGSTKTALQSELSNLVKAYNAKNAVEASYCHTLQNVGFTADGTTALYAKQAFLGLGAKAVSCGTALDEDALFIKTNGDSLGTCSDTTHVTETACTGAMETWTADADRAYTNDPNNCQLGEGNFYAGAVTGVSNLNIFYTTNEDGMITTQGGGSGDDPNGYDCSDVDSKYANIGGDLPGSVQ